MNFLTAIFNNKVNFLVSLLSDKVMVNTIHKHGDEHISDSEYDHAHDISVEEFDTEKEAVVKTRVLFNTYEWLLGS